MNEMRKTLMFAGAAAVLLVLAAVTAPKRVTPDAFFDQGEAFFPEFVDPNDARTLEVIEFDSETGEAVPFKVTFKGGRWTIPSHNDYPADGKDRLAQTAAGVIGITRDDFRTDNPADHELCGVLDPLDAASPSLAGRGQRVTIKGDNDVVLADLIIGKSFEGRENFRLVRVPGQKRVYGALMNIDISTSFADWIEADLMRIEKEEVDHIVLKDYSIDERTGQLNERDNVELNRVGEDWTAGDLRDDQEVNRTAMFNLVRVVDELTIEGVRPKPEGLSASLSKMDVGGVSIDTNDMVSLQSKGFYFTRDGRLVSNEGEVQVRAADGVTYTLRFGEVVYGKGLSVTAGGESEAAHGEGMAENRYLMITTSFTESLFPEPARPASTDFLEKPDSLWTEEDYRMKGLQTAHDGWQQKVDSGRARTDELNGRFARWYYVISSESFDKLNVTRVDVINDKAVQ